jgi:NADH-quinone oxidoreductase subunit L
VILAVASTIGWLLNAPFAGLDFINKWLAPVFPTTIAPTFQLSTGTKWVIGLIATGVVLIGIAVGLRAWLPSYQHPELEPAVLRHSWYIDEGVSATVSGPLTKLATALSFVLDARVVDGTVNGVAHFIAGSARQGRRLQTGYLRNYALGIGIGAAVLLAFVAFRATGGG